MTHETGNRKVSNPCCLLVTVLIHSLTAISLPWPLSNEKASCIKLQKTRGNHVILLVFPPQIGWRWPIRVAAYKVWLYRLLNLGNRMYNLSQFQDILWLLNKNLNLKRLKITIWLLIRGWPFIELHSVMWLFRCLICIFSFISDF